MGKIVFTREHPLEKDWTNTLNTLGLDIVHAPLIHCTANDMPKMILNNLHKADWVFFTSAVAAECFAPYMRDLNVRIATIGHKTTQSVEDLGHTVDFESVSQYGVDFVGEWLTLGLSHQTVLLPQSSLSNLIIAQTLKDNGHTALAWAMYDTKPNKKGQSMIEALCQEKDVIWTFASPSAWESLIQVREQLPKHHQVAVIGTTTQQAVMNSHQIVDFMPDTPAIDNMIETIIQNRERGE
ncbi:uroporphyrinogen-III synthase [Granulicatella sp. zg-ZJ]|uniref:uroporphyrinogen-III synthase n=1 Tax=Granulicatella sp. zg-ZJ TaxID=2678504 RepID=UPI0013D687FA|nr:uroporphyrinogen-III synthase [Granulicatella sp. zg-ZJ]NEW61827.1 uroporphyrinogen-III synthase [Granulicatella sp. zg-ZJ]